MEYERANIYSVSTSSLANLLIYLAHGLSGSKGSPPTSTPRDFLPFPKLEELFQEQERQGPSEATKELLNKLLKGAAIPAYVYTALSNAPPSSENR